MLPRSLGLAALLVCVGCPSGDVSSSEPSAAAPAAPGPAPAAEAKTRRSPPRAPLAPEPWHVPVGIALLIEPGKGVGPIRFGARLDTIERLMAEPCEQKKKQEPAGTLVCRYSAQAVEFFLSDGVLTSVRAHRLGRPFNGSDPKPDFGVYNGRFASGAALGMLMPAVQELLGKPQAVQPVTQANPFGTVELHDYAGFVLEYDRLATDTIVLGGIRLSAPRQPSSKSVQPR
jgi:hypothetical protein